jgi:phenylacetate-CoA ligase
MDKLIASVIAPLWAWHENSSYLGVARDLARGERSAGEERRARQWRALRALVEHAWAHCRFYRERFAAIGMEPGDLRDWTDLQSLPVLTKKDIRERPADLLAANVPRGQLIARKTSGSTGESLNFHMTEADYDYKRGISLYRDQWTGWRLGEWKAMVWGNPTYQLSWRGRLRNFLLERSFSLDTLKMDEAMMEDFAHEILSRRPTLLFGHAHSLYLFADFWRRRGLPRYVFRGILSTAMVLHGYEREGCEAVFGCRVFDRYGCEEVSLIASECEAHDGLHVNTDALVVEVLCDGRPASCGEEGAVVVTDLTNRTMPFIRYQVGDMAVPAARSCACGRTYPLLERVAGRIADYLLTPDGQWVSGISLTENFATLIPGVAQVQIIQDARDHLLLRLVATTAFGDHSRGEIQRLVRERFGEAMRFGIEFTERIPPEPSGKYRFAIFGMDR